VGKRQTERERKIKSKERTMERQKEKGKDGKIRGKKISKGKKPQKDKTRGINKHTHTKIKDTGREKHTEEERC